MHAIRSVSCCLGINHDGDQSRLTRHFGSPSPGLHLLAHSGMQPRGLMEGALAKAKIFGNLVTGRNLGNLETNHQGNDYRGRDFVSRSRVAGLLMMMLLTM